MSAAELATMQTVLERRQWKQGDIVFREGDAGDELFLIAQGAASVRLNVPGENRSVRLVTFSPGTLFGELALLDREARSATIAADTDLVCHVMSYAHFRQLSEEHPSIAIKLMEIANIPVQVVAGERASLLERYSIPAGLGALIAFILAAAD